MVLSTRALLRRLVLALCLVVPVGAGVTAAPASANHGEDHVWCYYYDNHVGRHTEWYGEGTGYRTDTFHKFYECTDGSRYEWWFQYEWYREYWVWTF